ncbi:MAG TPA: class I SAM-dependent methyltransferase [Saprospiraceae bacterium]|nr:class I SAM-dependent methyltransferase [Saprospiraceae bacterium]HMQ84448.1 class I SAM-dependent methyltransferase [Saprospiraceae bacterium]
MNYKLLFPTYRNRYQFIQRSLRRMAEKHKFALALNLGTGEGDYDQMIAAHCHRLKSCDINEQDIAFAKALNAGVSNIEYAVENALALSYPGDHFDLLISVDVIEHVGQPEQMVKEVSRVLKPGGLAMITFPSLDFPFTYDPINRILSFFSKKRIPQGAYAFGHEYLVSRKDFRQWAATYGLEVVFERNLSGYLVGLLEMYWTGIIQRIFKANATNISKQKDKKVSLRPSTAEPLLARLTDGINQLDHSLFGKAAHSVGKGFILRKASTSN